MGLKLPAQERNASSSASSNHPKAIKKERVLQCLAGLTKFPCMRAKERDTKERSEGWCGKMGGGGVHMTFTQLNFPPASSYVQSLSCIFGQEHPDLNKIVRQARFLNHAKRNSAQPSLGRVTPQPHEPRSRPCPFSQIKQEYGSLSIFLENNIKEVQALPPDLPPYASLWKRAQLFPRTSSPQVPLPHHNSPQRQKSAFFQPRSSFLRDWKAKRRRGSGAEERANTTRGGQALHVPQKTTYGWGLGKDSTHP